MRRLILAEFYLNDRNANLARQQIDAATNIAPRNSRVLMRLGNPNFLRP